MSLDFKMILDRVRQSYLQILAMHEYEVTFHFTQKLRHIS